MCKMVVVLYRRRDFTRETDDLEAFADLSRTSWSVVDEQVRR